MFYSPENDAKEDLLTKNYPFFVQQTFVNSPYYFSYFLDSGVARPTSIAIPPGATSVSLTTGSTANQEIFYEQPNLPVGYSENWNLTLQRLLTRTTSLEAGYVGAVSRKLSYAVGNTNYQNAISSEIGQVDTLTDAGMGNYNSLQVSLKQQMYAGLDARLSYTYSKTIDNGPGPFNIGAGQYPQNPYDLGAEYAAANYDLRQNFVGAVTYELPFGRGKWLLPNAGRTTQMLLGGLDVQHGHDIKNRHPGECRAADSSKQRQNSKAQPGAGTKSIQGTKKCLRVVQYCRLCKAADNANHHRHVGPQQCLRSGLHQYGSFTAQELPAAERRCL